MDDLSAYRIEYLVSTINNVVKGVNNTQIKLANINEKIERGNTYPSFQIIERRPEFNNEMLYPEGLHPHFPIIGKNDYNLEDTANFVDLVVNKHFHARIGKNIEFDLDHDDKGKFELQRLMLDASTGFVTYNFLASRQSNINFFKVVNTCMTHVVNEYKRVKGLDERDILFIYKGGNALRSIFKKVLKLFPLSVSEIIDNNFRQYFKKSDLDFGIVINPRLQNWDIVYKDIQEIVYLTLNRIRNIFLLNLDNFFDFYKYNEYTKKKLMTNLWKWINDSKFMKNNNNVALTLKFQGLTVGQPLTNVDETQLIQEEKNLHDWEKYANSPYRSDIRIRKQDGRLAVSKIIKINNDKYQELKDVNVTQSDIELQNIYYKNSHNNEMYISWNDSIDFRIPDILDPRNQDIITKFCLIRMKVNFTTQYLNNRTMQYGIMNVPGELIDVSITHKDSLESAGINFGVNGDIASYNLEEQDDVKFNGYTYTYYMKDLIRMIMQEMKFPWLISKYEKRINRLFFMFTMIFLKEYADTNHKDNLIIQINDIYAILSNITDETTIETVAQNITTIKEILHNLIIVGENAIDRENNRHKIYNFYEILEKQLTFREDVESTKSDMIGFMQFMGKGWKIVKEVLDAMKQFVEHPIQYIQISTDYPRSTTSLHGGCVKTFNLKYNFN